MTLIIAIYIIVEYLRPIDSTFVGNYIIGSPKVICEENDVTLDLITSKPFDGNIFVKGRSKDSSCRQSYANGVPKRNLTKAYSLTLGECGMRRIRQVNPRGINFAVTLHMSHIFNMQRYELKSFSVIIVSFHPDGFITKNDRAYHIQCFYLEVDKIVTSDIKVSGLPTQDLSSDIGLPICEYTVRSNSVDGPLLIHASVGEIPDMSLTLPYMDNNGTLRRKATIQTELLDEDPGYNRIWLHYNGSVYHVWKCKGADMGLLIKRCFVTDGDGKDHAVIDQNGCSVDSTLLSEVTYNGYSMLAYAKSQAFKYADSNQLYFTCQIKLCQKDMHLCDGVTPPKCNSKRSRRKRHIKFEMSSQHKVEDNLKFLILKQRRRGLRPLELDVTTPQLFIFDGVEQQEREPTLSNISHDDLSSINLPGPTLQTIASVNSPISLRYLLLSSIALSLLWTTTLMIIAAYCIYKKLITIHFKNKFYS